MNEKKLTLWEIRQQISQAEKLGISLEKLSKELGVPLGDLRLLKELIEEGEEENKSER